MRSKIRASAAGEHGLEPPLHPSDVVPVTSTTLPPVALMLIGVESVTSAIGSGAPLAPPDASCTSKYCPGARLVLGSSVIRFVALPKFPVPVVFVLLIRRPP